MYFLVVHWLGKLLMKGLRLTGWGGAALPGLVVEKLYPSFISRMSQKLSGGVTLVTGTNGKTTTVKLLAGILRSRHQKLITNTSGSNMSRGIASAFLEHSDFKGKPNGNLALFEVDEAFMEDMAGKTHPKLTVVLNLLRDQLDRYGELDRTAELIAAGLEHSQTAALNADDPMVAHLGRAVPSGKVVFFGAAEHLRAKLPHDEELLKRKSTRKPKVRSGRTDKFSSRLNFLMTKVQNRSEQQEVNIVHKGKNYQATTQLPGVYNAYNAVAALAAADTLGIGLKTAIEALDRVQPAFGRTELIELGDKKLQLLLVKNPAGFNQIISNFLLSTKNLPLLMAINDNFADGRDVSWLWDVDFEQMAKQGHQIITSGARGYDLAVRLKYAQIKSQTELDLALALKQFVNSLAAGATGYVVPTYTAMLSLRKLIGRRTKVPKAWRL